MTQYKRMKRFLSKIIFDCNDGDDVYGLQVITEVEAEIVRRNSHKQISFGSGDWGENTESIGSCIKLQLISEEEYNMLVKLGLDRFGEYFYPGELDSMSIDGEDEYEGDDEGDDDDDDKQYSNNYGLRVIKRTTPSGEVYFLREKDPENNREVVHKSCGKSFERIGSIYRAKIYDVNEIDLQKIVDELNAQCETPEFKIV